LAIPIPRYTTRSTKWCHIAYPDLGCRSGTSTYKAELTIQEKFLPALPPISASTNPNDIKKTIRQIEETTKKVEGVLQGGMMDGVRPVPLIDWTLESTIVTVPKGYGGPNGDKGVVVYKPFGMSTY
jgi:hypothetical protein